MMTQVVAILMIVALSLPAPLHAGVVRELEPVEKELLIPPSPSDIENQRLSDEFADKTRRTSGAAEVKSGSSWWKWALGIALVGGAAVAAAGGGGGGGSTSSDTGNGTVSW